MKMTLKKCRLLIMLVTFYSIAGSATATSPLYEFRGVWVATVTNIDWPSRAGLDVNSMKREVNAILDIHQQLGMNSIILQVRPAGDAIYPSALEPWSKYLMGEQGLAPRDNFDPLKYWIEESHKRGLEFHAWINPFRAALRSEEPLHITHPAAVHPHWTVNHNNRLYYNPGISEVREHIKRVVFDLVSRYDIDGLHLDDYFYPYPVTGFVFNDSATYIQQLNFEAPLSIHDWRRENINTFIRETGETIKQIKPWVKFGISPFGVWRNQSDDPRGSDSRAGVTCYDHLYADVLKWEKEGWIDYIAPQIYWSTTDEAANYTKLVKWWNQEITNRHLYIGHGIYKINNGQAAWNQSDEMSQQIKLARQHKNVAGSIYFSHKHFTRDNNNLNATLQNQFYSKTALTPPMPWLTGNMRPMPVQNVQYRRGVITWEADKSAPPTNRTVKYVVFYKPAGGGEEQWVLTTNPFIRPEILPTDKRSRYYVQIAALDRLNNMSERSEVIRLRF
jgi:uncharacterized lipoprotein YddW (UPF0748 family)